MSKALNQLEELMKDSEPSSTPSTPSTLSPLSKAEKLKALLGVEKSLNKKYECKLVQKMGDKVGEKWPSISTGCYTFDEEVAGCGGLPKGRIIEVFGPESSGKTTWALHCIAQAQKQGGVAGFVDAEHSLDPTYASKLGVNVDELLISQPDYGEQALEVVLALLEARAVDILVVDSVAALVPLAELEGDMGDSHMGLQARLMSQAMRKLVGVTSRTGTVLVFINQIREKVGVVYGNPEVTTGGRALKFASALRLEVRRVSGENGTIKEGENQIGHRIQIKAVKNKMAPPARKTQISLYYDSGIDMADDLVQYAVELGVVEPGAWCVFQGKKYRRKDLQEGEVFATLKLAVEEAIKNKGV